MTKLQKWHQVPFSTDLCPAQFGTSLPSSVVTVNVTRTLRGESVKGRPSAPHGLMVAETGIDYLEVSWSGPAISDPEDTLKYK